MSKRKTGKVVVNPFKNRNIGRRTGRDVKAGKAVRKTSGGFENFDDYWSESEAEVTREGTFLKPNDPGIKQADSSSTKLQAVNSSQHSQAEKLPALQSQNVGPPSLSQTQQSEASYHAHVKITINPFKNQKIGRRTGRDIKAGKHIRVLDGGFENFDDYWSESDADSMVSFSNSAAPKKADMTELQGTGMLVEAETTSENEPSSDKESKVTTSIDGDSAEQYTAEEHSEESIQKNYLDRSNKSRSMQLEVAGEDDGTGDEAILAQEDIGSKRDLPGKLITQQKSPPQEKVQQSLEKVKGKRKVLEEKMVSTGSQGKNENVGSSKLLEVQGTDTESHDKCSCSEAEESTTAGTDCQMSDADDFLIQKIKRQTAALQQVLVADRPSQEGTHGTSDKQTHICRQSELNPAEVVPECVTRENYYKGEMPEKNCVEKSTGRASTVLRAKGATPKALCGEPGRGGNKINIGESKMDNTTSGNASNGQTEEENHTLLAADDLSQLKDKSCVLPEATAEKSNEQSQNVASGIVQQSGISQLTANASPLPVSQKSSIYLSIAGDVTGSITRADQSEGLTPQPRLFDTRKRLSYGESPKSQKPARVTQKQRQTAPVASPIAEVPEERKNADKAIDNLDSEEVSQSPQSPVSEAGMFVSLASQNLAKTSKVFSDEEDDFDILDVSQVYSRRTNKARSKPRQKDKCAPKICQEKTSSQNVLTKETTKVTAEKPQKELAAGGNRSLRKPKAQKERKQTEMLAGADRKAQLISQVSLVDQKTEKGGGRSERKDREMAESKTSLEETDLEVNLEAVDTKPKMPLQTRGRARSKSVSAQRHTKKLLAKSVSSERKARTKRQEAELQEDCLEQEPVSNVEETGDETLESYSDDRGNAAQRAGTQSENQPRKQKKKTSDAYDENTKEEATDNNQHKVLTSSKTTAQRKRRMKHTSENRDHDEASQEETSNDLALSPAKRSSPETYSQPVVAKSQGKHLQTSTILRRSSVGKKKLYDTSKTNVLDFSHGSERNAVVTNADSLFHTDAADLCRPVESPSETSKRQVNKKKQSKKNSYSMSGTMSDLPKKGKVCESGTGKLLEGHVMSQGRGAKNKRQTPTLKRKCSSESRLDLEDGGHKKQFHKRGRSNANDLAKKTSPDKVHEEPSMMKANESQNLPDKELAAFSSTPVSHLHILDIPESALKSGISFRRISYLPSVRTRGKHSRRKLVAHSAEVEDDIISSPHLGKYTAKKSSEEDTEKAKSVTSGNDNCQTLTPCLTAAKSKNKMRRVTINNTVTEHQVSGSENEGITTVLPSMSSSPVHYQQITFLSSPQKCRWEEDKIIPPEENVEGLRRSQRTRVRPLEWYKNERIVYERRKSGAVIVAVQPSNEKLYLEQENRKRRQRRQANLVRRKTQSRKGILSRRLSIHTKIPDELEVTKSTEIPVFHPDTQEEVLMGCFNPAESGVLLGPHGNDPSPKDPFTLKLITQQKLFTTGVLTLAPQSEKPLQRTISTAVIYAINYGKVIITINRATSILQTGDHFFVPKGSVYSLRNLRQDEAILTFTNLLLDTVHNTGIVTNSESPAS